MKGYGQKRYLQQMINLMQSNDHCTTHVVLNGFQITDAKLAVLAMALVDNTHLKTLHLDGNSISDQGAGLLAYAIQQNTTIQCISLNDNLIRSAGADAISLALYDNKTLRTLRLANNCIGNHGARGLLNVLRHNDSMWEIVLDGNNIGEKMAAKFDDRCRIQCPMETLASDAIVFNNTGSDFNNFNEATKGIGHMEPEEEAESNTSNLEWGASSALSLFGASLYMNNNDARKYIIGCEDHLKEDLDAGSSWNNLASYMKTVQNMIDQQENEGECHNDNLVVFSKNLDDLSVASESESNSQTHVSDEKQKHRKRKKWSIFKKILPSKKTHTPGRP